MDWRKVFMANFKKFSRRVWWGDGSPSIHLTLFSSLFSFSQLIKLLDGKRSQAVGILISSLHLEMKDIQQGEQNSFLNMSCPAAPKIRRWKFRSPVPREAMSCCSDKTTERSHKTANTSCKRCQPHAINTLRCREDSSKMDLARLTF